MTILKKSDRQEILNGVLTVAFKPRFDATQAALVKFVKRKIAEEHPHFLKAYADENLRSYLAHTKIRALVIPGGDRGKSAITRPIYGGQVAAPRSSYVRISDGYAPFDLSDVTAPASCYELAVDDAEITDKYLADWADYAKAYSVLSALLAAYPVREKLLAEFPEYADYLPEIAVKKQLPAVQVAVVRGELSALGVPPK